MNLICRFRHKIVDQFSERTGPTFLNTKYTLAHAEIHSRMKSRLDTINDWELLARKAQHKAAELARLTGVSLRQLERFFEQRKDCCPHAWLVQTRLSHAIELLRQGRSNKEVALAVGFQTVSALFHFFQEHTGFPPSGFHREAASSKDILHCSELHRKFRRTNLPEI